MQMETDHLQHDKTGRQGGRIPEVLSRRGLHSDHRLPKRPELERTNDLPAGQKRVLHRGPLAQTAPSLALDLAQQEQALHHARVPQENHRQKAQLAVNGRRTASGRAAGQAIMIN